MVATGPDGNNNTSDKKQDTFDGGGEFEKVSSEVEEKNKATSPMQDTQQSSISQGKSSNGTDAQITAHRLQHQQQLKKLLLIVSALVAAIVVTVLIWWFTSQVDTSLETNESVAEVSLSQQQLEEFRSNFKQSLTRFEIEIQPQLDEIALTQWKTAELGQIKLVKEQVLTAFAKGEFLQAKENLQDLEQKALALLSEQQTLTQKHIQRAQEFFEEQQIPEAQLALNQAFAVMPNNQQAQALQSRIEAFAQISELLGDLKVAKVERNLPKQIDILADIIDLDPERDALNRDLQQAEVAFQQQQLEQALQQAEVAFNNEQYQQASQLVKKALDIDANSQGAAMLSEKITQAQAEQNIAQTKASLAELAAKDNWQQVAVLSRSALNKYTSDLELREYAKLSQQILEAKQSLQIFLSKPQRLADENIRQAAQRSIQKAFSSAMYSPSLQQQIETVATSIDSYSQKVDVSIHSDGKTYLTVIGVGHVGFTEQKTIQLTPGSYTLLGKREGYQDKRLEFTVSPDSDISLTLICEQKI